jgi:hypothetical protein
MRHRSRLLLGSALLGFVSALALILATFVVSLKFRELAQVVWIPGEFLVQVSNGVCPPLGVECFLGSTRLGAQHLWLLICAAIAWSFIFFAAWWSGLTLAARIRSRAYAGRRSLFLHKRQGLS